VFVETRQVHPTPAYNASKFAVEAWSDSLRLELEPFRISVVNVRPGQISTSIQQDWTTNLLKNYETAPPQIRELYGEERYSDMIRKVFEFFAKGGNTLTQPKVGVDALLDTIHTPQRKLQSCYWIGSDAHTLWRALHVLPASVADTVKRGILHFAPLQQPLPPAEVYACHYKFKEY